MLECRAASSGLVDGGVGVGRSDAHVIDDPPLLPGLLWVTRAELVPIALVDAFHARSYCGVFSAPCVAALMLSRRASPAELWTLGSGQVIWGGGAAMCVPLLGWGSSASTGPRRAPGPGSA
jgi:hypothetical protein